MRGVTRPILAVVACAAALTAASSSIVFAANDRLPRGGMVVASIRIPQNSGALAVGEGAVWATSDAVATLMRIDPKSNSVVARTRIESHSACPELPGSCGEAAAGNGAVWLARISDNTILRINPSDDSMTATIPVGPQPEGIAVTPGAVWVVNKGGPSVSRIDPATNQVVATIRIGSASACCSDHMALAAGAGAVWASLPERNMVVRIDPATNAVAARVRLSEPPCGFLVADSRTVWSGGDHCAARVVRIDPKTNRQSGTVGKALVAPLGLALGFGSLWVADLDAKAIDRINPRTARVVARLPVGGHPVRLAIGFGSVWVRDDAGRVLRIKPAVGARSTR
jgi:virginiamycin B lyase